jgi:hypothetical protein
MNKPQNDEHTAEDQLADFTDQILEKITDEENAPFSPDPELRALEQTSLRLKNTFHNDGPTDAVIQKMRQNIILEWKERERKASQSFWRKFFVKRLRERKWQSQQSQQRWSMLGSLALVSVVMVISILILNKVEFKQPAASGPDLSSGVLVATGALVILALWIFRRK